MRCWGVSGWAFLARKFAPAVVLFAGLATVTGISAASAAETNRRLSPPDWPQSGDPCGCAPRGCQSSLEDGHHRHASGGRAHLESLWRED